MTVRDLIRLAAVPAAIAAGMAGAPAATAAAPCVSATPQAVTQADASSDAEPGAPEISAIRAAVGADCTVSVRLTIENRDALRPDDALLVYLNTDGDPSTGADSFGGGDLGVGLIADEDGPGYLALLGTWDPAAQSIDFEDAREIDVTTGGGFGFTAGIDELGVRSGGTLGISVAALSEPDGEIALDFSPDEEGGVLALPLTFSTTAAAPAGTTTKTPSGKERLVRRTCRVPKKLTGRTVTAVRRKLRRAGCRPGRLRARYGTSVRTGRVVGVLPRSGARISANRPVTILVSRR